MRQSWSANVCLLVLWACLPTGCDRGSSSSPAKTAGPAQEQVELPAHKVEYRFSAGLEDEFPEVTDFLRCFLETALAGDYQGYRRLVCRMADPEGRDRFEKVLNSLRNLTIQSIEEIELPEVSPLTYLVIAQVEFVPGRKVTLRRGSESRIAILVLEEESELRMAPAPPELQPEEGSAPVPSAPATSGPSYPWEQDGDY